MEKIFTQNQDCTGVVNYTILTVCSQTISISTINYEIATVRVEYDSNSNQEYATISGTPIADKLSSLGIINQNNFTENYTASFVNGSILDTTISIINQINLLDNWFAVRVTNQNIKICQVLN